MHKEVSMFKFYDKAVVICFENRERRCRSMFLSRLFVFENKGTGNKLLEKLNYAA